MNRGWSLFLGFFATFLTAWIGLVAAPYLQIGGDLPHEDKDTGDLFPPNPGGLVEEGRRVYAVNGCVYCHSQQVRPETTGSDIARGWGARRTVSRDYINEKPVMLGTMRTGPDLSNIGQRQSSRAWHHAHLYDPQGVTPWSTMPPFRYLYRIQKAGPAPAPDAFKVEGPHAPPPGHEIVPTREARALVEYLISLNRSYSLPEAPAE